MRCDLCDIELSDWGSWIHDVRHGEYARHTLMCLHHDRGCTFALSVTVVRVIEDRRQLTWRVQLLGSPLGPDPGPEPGKRFEISGACTSVYWGVVEMLGTEFSVGRCESWANKLQP